MQEEKVTIINISWEKIPFNGYDFSEINKKNNEADYGIYQICGHHNAYGFNALLYIGKAQEQTFAARLGGRWEFLESCVQPTSIRFGRIVHPSNPDAIKGVTKEQWKTLINIAEKILIKTHLPAMNKQENTGLFDKNGLDERHYIILNWYEYGNLLPEVSTFSSSYHCWEFDTPFSEKDFK